MYLPTRITLAVTALCVSTPIAFSETTSQLSLDQLRNDHPKLRVFEQAEKITKMALLELVTCLQSLKRGVYALNKCSIE